MKKIILITIFSMFVMVIPTQAQTPYSKVGDPTTYLTPEQLAKYTNDIQIAELEKKLKVYGNWVGVGGEVGNAIEEGLTAVVDVADKFGKTDVGKYTMILVAWKVVGKDVIRILLGFIFLILITLLFIGIYKSTYVPKRNLIERTPNGFWKRATKKYEIIKPDDDWDGYNLVKILMLFLYTGAVGISYAIMFAS